MHHAVHPALQGGQQGALKIGGKFRSSSASLNSRVKRKIGVGSNLGHFALCRLGLAYSMLCWVSLHSTQPTFCRCYCELRNPTMADFRTEPGRSKAQVGIGRKQDADYTHRSALITSRRFSVTLGLRRSSITRPSETSRRSSVVRTRSRS